jgi:glucan phosphoethanolaminetransferase (alkaline phosphatase superfamily)
MSLQVGSENIDELNKIEKIDRQFQTLNAAYEDRNIIVYSNYTNYIVLIFVIIFLIFLLLRISFSGPPYRGLFNSNITIIFAFIILFFIVLVAQKYIH